MRKRIIKLADIVKEAEQTEEFPLASNVTSGLNVDNDVPNISSISASFNEYDVLPGIREVSMDYINAPPDVNPQTKDLVNQMNNSKVIKPLIVAVDSEGPYILEGAHRYDALKILGISSFPALVVIDKD